MSTTPTVTDKLKVESLSWALTHVLRYGDTDLFPVPFEYDVIKAYWTVLLPALSDFDFANHELSPAIKIMLPKSSTGYRAITQMDPLDTILFTAAVYEATPAVEAFRAAKAARIDCAYRADIKSDGQLFSAENSGWKDFHARGAELVGSGKFTHIVCADVADYYSQASHHRIQNALSKAGVEHGRTKNIEEFLSRLNSLHHSRGIPVGPSSGIILGEVCLADVDAALARKGYVHARYVDDFRIFCRNRDEAEIALHDLSEYLFTAHRLSLQQGKTRILDIPTFQREEMLDPEELEVEAKRERVDEFLKSLELDEYDDEQAWPIDEVDETNIDLQTLRDLFLRAVDGRLSVGLAKYVLRRAAKLRTRVFLDDLLQRLPVMLPVIRDTMLFLIKAAGSKDAERIGTALRSLAADARYGFLPIVSIWVIEAFCRKPCFCSATNALHIAESSHPLLRDRLAALVARSYNIPDWVREKKETWLNYGPWAQRAILHASSVLPEDERVHWLKSAYGHPLLLTQAVAKVTKGVA